MKAILILALLVSSVVSSLAQSVTWDRADKVIVADSNTMPPEVTGRVFLVSNSTTLSRIDRVIFTGLEASEFRVNDNQYLLNPLEGFDLAAQALMWVDIAFVPDYSKPFPLKFADRHAILRATYFVDAKNTVRDTTYLAVTGTFNQVLSVAQSPSTADLKVYTVGKQIVVELPQSDAQPNECSLYDILGRKVSTWGKTNVQLVGSTIYLPMPSITSGEYILRIGSGNDQKSCVLLIP